MPTSQRESMNRLRRAERMLSPVGWVLALATAALTYWKTDSFWLALFGFVMVSRFVIGSVPKIIHHSRRLSRALFYLLLPGGGTLVLYLVYRWSEVMWLAVILGLAGGVVFSMLVGLLFFRHILGEEAQREEQVADFVVDEMLAKHPDAAAMKQRFSTSEWEDIKQFPAMIFGIVALAEEKKLQKHARAMADAIIEPERYEDPLLRMMLIDMAAATTLDIGKMGSLTEITGAFVGGVLKRSFEELARQGKLQTSGEGGFAVTPEALHLIKDNLSPDELRSFLHGLFKLGMEIVQAGGKAAPEQVKALVEFLAISAESKEDLFATLGVERP